MPDPSSDFAADDARVERAAEGDPDALADLLGLLGPRVRDQLWIGPRWRALVDEDDVMQASYLEAFLRVRTLQARTVSGFTAWLVRVAQNNLKDAVKGLSAARRPDSHRGPSPEESAAFLLAELGATSHTASRDAVAREAVTRLRGALARLPETYRRVVELYDLQQLDVADVARALERSPGAVFMLRARAHDRLRDVLGPASDLLGH